MSTTPTPAHISELAEFLRWMDIQGRPVTMAADYSDILTLSYYNSDFYKVVLWPPSTPVLDGLNMVVLEAVEKRWQKTRKPILVGEFGLSTHARGCWREDSVLNFKRLLKETEYLREKGLIIGEMNWTCDPYYRRPPIAPNNDLLFRETLSNRFAHLVLDKS